MSDKMVHTTIKAVEAPKPPDDLGNALARLERCHDPASVALLAYVRELEAERARFQRALSEISASDNVWILSEIADRALANA